MLNRKPEFIDPEENKLIYYYNRNGRRKTLEEKNYYRKRRGFLVFNSPKARFALVVVYLMVLGYLYFSSSRYRKGNKIIYDDVKIRIINYYVKSEKKVYLNIVFSTKTKEEKYLYINSVHIKLSRDSFFLEKDIALNQRIKILPNYHYTLKFQIFSKEKPLKISVILYVKENDDIVSLKMRNLFK